jgi:hypothetical protein
VYQKRQDQINKTTPTASPKPLTTHPHNKPLPAPQQNKHKQTQQSSNQPNNESTNVVRTKKTCCIIKPYIKSNAKSNQQDYPPQPHSAPPTTHPNNKPLSSPQQSQIQARTANKQPTNQSITQPMWQQRKTYVLSIYICQNQRKIKSAKLPYTALQHHQQHTLHNKPQTTSKQSNNQKHKTENHNKQTAASTQHVPAS